LCGLLRGWGFSHSFFHVCNNAKWVLIPTFFLWHSFFWYQHSFYDIPFCDINAPFIYYVSDINATFIMFSNCVDYCFYYVFKLCGLLRGWGISHFSFHIFWLLSPPLVDNIEAFHIFRLLTDKSLDVRIIAWLRLFTFFDCLPTRLTLLLLCFQIV
jgi:hypothetical protein